MRGIFEPRGRRAIQHSQESLIALSRRHGINRPDGVMVIDVRLTLQMEEGVLIYLTYQGRFLAEQEAMARFAKGALLDRSEYSLAIRATFECGDDRYAWINNVIAVGTGEQTPSGPIYTIFEIG